MTQAELLNYIVKKEKIKKEDLAKLFGIRKKNTDKVFSGEIKLNKKQIKYTSKFTGIPEAVIKSGEYSLPDSENTGVVFIDEELIKNQNTARFESFIKTRFKSEMTALLILKLFTYFILLSGLIMLGFTFYSAFIENIDKSTTFIALFTLVPYFLTFASIVPLFKITRKVNVNEKGRFKVFYSIIIASLLISVIGTLIFDAFNWVYLILSFIPLAVALLTLLIEKKPAKNQKLIKNIATGIILFFLFVLAIAIELIESTRETFFAVTYLVQFCALISATVCYRDFETFEDFSKSFGMLSKKKVYKKKRVMSALISALLVTAIIAGGTHFAVLFVVKASVNNVVNRYEVQPYSEYNKQNLVFSEEETQSISNGIYSYKIPTEYINVTTPDRYSETLISKMHSDLDKTVMISSLYDGSKKEEVSSILNIDNDMIDSATEDYGILGESLEIAFSKYDEMIENTLEEKYGFAPKNMYEFRKLGAIMNPKEINFWNKQEAISHISLVVMYSVAMPIYDEIYLQEAKEIVGIVNVKTSTNEETGKTDCLYYYEFDTPDSEWLNCTLIIRLPEELASTDLAYKIINSVEIK